MATYIEVVSSLYASEAHFNATLSPAIWFDSISVDGREFRFNSDLKVPVTLDEGLVVLQTKEIPIIAYGESLPEAIANFQEQFAFVWDSITAERDENLTPDAQRVKRLQQALVADIAQAA
jgi:hypothetical protein